MQINSRTDAVGRETPTPFHDEARRNGHWAGVLFGSVLSFDNDKRRGLFQSGVIIGPFPQASDDRETNISLPPEYAGGDNVCHHANS